MAVKSRGRGAAAVIGLCCLLVGLVGGAVLFIVAERRPLTNVEGFARAPVGCVTTLEFSEVGTFYVFEEVGGSDAEDLDGCEPVADPTAPFGVEFTGDLTPASADDTTELSYDVGGFDGRSVRSIEVDEPGQYTVEVTGDDLTVLAAIGRDPEQGVDDLRRAALILAGAGIVVGLALLTLSGRRSKRAAVVTTPSGPGWGPAPRAGGGPTTAGGPLTGQVPVNPHARPEPGEAPAWQPPTGGAADDLEPPEPSELPPPTTGTPVLPDTPGRPSGT